MAGVGTEAGNNLINNSKRIVLFTGAGVSTPSGIPDFKRREWTLHKRAKIFELERDF